MRWIRTADGTYIDADGAQVVQVNGSTAILTMASGARVDVHHNDQEAARAWVESEIVHSDGECTDG